MVEQREKETAMFNSSAVSMGSYDPETQELELTYASGRTYTYYRVPQYAWDSLKTATSKGREAAKIKAQYGV